MPWYGPWVTPPEKTSYPSVNRETVAINVGGSTTVASQEAAIAAGASSTPSTGTTPGGARTAYSGHQESGHPSSSPGAGHATQIDILTPVPVTFFNDYPADWEGADEVLFDTAGHVNGFEATLRGIGAASSYVDGGSWSNANVGAGAIFWDLAFAFSLVAGVRQWPGPVWRTWSSAAIAMGATVDTVVTLPATGAKIAVVAAADWLTTPIDTSAAPYTSPHPSWVTEQLTVQMFSMACKWQPNNYQLYYADDNPPPWAAVGTNHLRQRQNPAGNSGGVPLRARQNAGDSGAWPMRAR